MRARYNYYYFTEQSFDKLKAHFMICNYNMRKKKKIKCGSNQMLDLYMYSLFRRQIMIK